MKPVLNLLKLRGTPIYQQLQLEEALLRADDANWCILNEGSSPAIVMGISGIADELIYEEKIQQIPVIRRFSGGGTVVVDEETLFVTMVCNRVTINIPAFPNQILCWNGALYSPFLKEKGFRIKENDYAIGEKKCGGNAQYICKERWLHHSTLLWDFNKERMDLLKIPKKMPEYRMGRDHSKFLCVLKDHLESKDHFFNSFLSSLSEKFRVREVSLQEAETHLDRKHRKSTAII